MCELQVSGDSEDDMSSCVDEVFHYTVNSSRLRADSVHGGSATFRQRVDNVDVDGDTDELVYVADIAGTNLLLVVVDGRRTAETRTTAGITHRQVSRRAHSSARRRRRRSFHPKCTPLFSCGQSRLNA